MDYAIGEAVSLGQLLAWEYSRMRGRAFPHKYRGRVKTMATHVMLNSLSISLVGFARLCDFAQQEPLHILYLHTRVVVVYLRLSWFICAAAVIVYLRFRRDRASAPPP